MPKHGHYYIDTLPEIPWDYNYGVPSSPGGTHREGTTKYTTENGNFDAHWHGDNGTGYTLRSGGHIHYLSPFGDHIHTIPTEGIATSSTTGLTSDSTTPGSTGSSGILTSDSTTPGSTGSTGLTSDSTTPGSTGSSGILTSDLTTPGFSTGSATPLTYRPYAGVGIIIVKS
jgi:hypothetical protein